MLSLCEDEVFKKIPKTNKKTKPPKRPKQREGTNKRGDSYKSTFTERPE